jgi:GT2 family glycosyltransferase
MKKVKKGYTFDKHRMYGFLRDFAVNKSDIKGDGEFGKRVESSTKESVDIIFLTHNQLEMTLECLDALERNTSHPFRLIWVDNGSEQNAYNMIKERVKSLKGEIHRFDVNRFYAKAVNHGFVHSKSRYIVTLSNDVFVTPKWLTKLYATMEKDPKIGLLSPLTDNIGSTIPSAEKAIRRNHLPVDGAGYEKINLLPLRFEKAFGNISMFCAMIKKEAIEKIGMLDERFFILGNDDDYCDRIRLAGYKTGVCLNCFVYHRHGVTKDAVFAKNSPERNAIKRDHQALLKEKRKARAMMGMLG